MGIAVLHGSASRSLTGCYRVRGGENYRGRPAPRGLIAMYPAILFRLAPDSHPLCIFRYEGDCAKNTDRIIFDMPDHTWGVLEPVYSVNPNDLLDAAAKKYSHKQLHKGNLALVHSDSRLGPGESWAWVRACRNGNCNIIRRSL
jgi:hypothetical protein